MILRPIMSVSRRGRGIMVLKGSRAEGRRQKSDNYSLAMDGEYQWELAARVIDPTLPCGEPRATNYT